jgi:holo-[acyl-carrier protein] synthase
VVILHGPSGQPYYELRGTALERMQAMGGRRIFLSMTHEEDLAAAVAVLE